MALANIKLGNQDVLELGNLDSQRDWGFAGDYVEGMWMMLQQDKADDYVLATNKTYTIRYFVETAAKVLGYDIEWKGENENTIGIDKKTGKTIVKVNPKFFRPCEVELLIGNPEKAKTQLGWKPKVQVEELAKMMVESDYNLLKK